MIWLKNPTRKFVALVSVILLLICTLCAGSLLALRTTTNDESIRYFTEFSQSIRQLVDERIQQSLVSLASLATDYTHIQNTDADYDLNVLQEQADLMDFTHIVVLRRDGTGFSSDGRRVDYSGSPGVMAVMEGQRLLIPADKVHSEEMGRKFLLAVPIYTDHYVTGAMVACTSDEWTSNWLIPTFFQGDLFFHLVDPEGDYLMRSNNPHVMEGEAVPHGLEERNIFEVLEKHATIQNGITVDALRQAALDRTPELVRFSLNAGETRLGYLMPLQHCNAVVWVVMMEQAAVHQYERIYMLSLLVNLVIVAVCLLLAGMLFILYRRNNQLAFTDAVTGGYSPVRFHIEAQKIVRSAPPNTYMMISVNVDKFKVINDLFGVEQGDAALRYIYNSLRDQLSEGEMVARSFADQFFILMRSRPQEAVIASFEQIVRGIRKDFDRTAKERNQQSYLLSLHIGVYPVDEPDLPLTLIQDRAQIAQKYHAVPLADHISFCGFYTESEREEILWEKTVENRMEEAMAAHRFLTFLQPKVDLATHRIVGAEALVRWKDPKYGMITPDRFIPIFEKSGFIRQVDLYVFETVCAYLRRRMDQGQEIFPISFNLSRSQISAPDFLAPYLHLREQYDIPPELLDFELTETMLLENSEIVTGAIRQVHAAGFHCSLDDFGSGYSSLNLLRNLQVNTLKLDRAFLSSPSADDPRERAVVEQMVQLARKLGMTCCAEGVETPAQAGFLASIHCEKGQGYLFSRPIPMEEFDNFFTHWSG